MTRINSTYSMQPHPRADTVGKDIATAKAVLGIIGGSGVYDLPGVTNAQSKINESPWGKPSSPPLTGEIAGLPIIFLSRHDKGHRLSAAYRVGNPATEAKNVFGIDVENVGDRRRSMELVDQI